MSCLIDVQADERIVFSSQDLDGSMYSVEIVIMEVGDIVQTTEIAESATLHYVNVSG
jgi:ABC-type proline/glycine betaine transport system ATPase subunit